MKIKPHFGSAVEGEQRFPRPKLEEKLLRLLQNSNGIGMFGLRRTGKSTLTRFAEDAMRDRGYSVVTVDAQGFRALDHLLFDMLRALPKERGVAQRLLNWASGSGAVPTALREALNLALQGVGPRDKRTTETITSYWQAIADQIAQSLRADRADVLLTIDEFPFMCKGIIDSDGAVSGRATVNQLLAALRLWGVPA